MLTRFVLAFGNEKSVETKLPQLVDDICMNGVIGNAVNAYRMIMIG